MALTANTDARFGHLLEPIRELAQNWSIDIAAELEDYLSELETITISFEDGQQLDFAEAALLIQGSSCVYSKKVEHLYALVLNTLNQLIDKRNDQQQEKPGKKKSGGGGEEAEAEPEPEDDDDAFTTLDDALKEVDNISLPAAQQTATRDARAFTLTSAPLALLPSSGDVNTTSDGSGDSKMHECALHASGALLLPNVHVPSKVLAALPAPPPPPSMWTRRTSAPPPTAMGTNDQVPQLPAGDDDGQGDFDDDDTPMWEPDNDHAENADSWLEAVEVLNVPAPPVNPDEQGEHTGSGGWGDVLGSGRESPKPMEPATPAPTRSAARAPAAAAIGKAPFDPWKALDPHDKSGAARRPFRKGRTYTAPPTAATSVAQPDADDDEEEEEAGDKENALGSVGINGVDVLRRLGLLCPASASATATAGGAASATTVVVPLRAPLWGQFGVLHEAVAKQRAVARKLRRQEAARRVHVPSVEVLSTEVEEVEVEAAALIACELGTGGDGLAGDFGGEDPWDDDDIMGGGDDDDDGFGNDNFDATQPTQQAPSAFGRFGASSTQNYEEMCRKHVESCLEASAGYQDDADIYQRVAEWQAKVRHGTRLLRGGGSPPASRPPAANTRELLARRWSHFSRRRRSAASSTSTRTANVFSPTSIRLSAMRHAARRARARMVARRHRAHLRSSPTARTSTRFAACSWRRST